MSDKIDIQARMSELTDLDRSDLRVAWIDMFETAPPHHLSMTFMRKAIIHEEQCRQFGGLSPALKRALKAAAEGKPISSAAVTACKPGTQLIREWNGKVFKVEVKEDGYQLEGNHFKSLSAIALHITGTSWSGPRFFGLAHATGISQ
jgi:hypothetical protein